MVVRGLLHVDLKLDASHGPVAGMQRDAHDVAAHWQRLGWQMRGVPAKQRAFPFWMSGCNVRAAQTVAGSNDALPVQRYIHGANAPGRDTPANDGQAPTHGRVCRTINDARDVYIQHACGRLSCFLAPHSNVLCFLERSVGIWSEPAFDSDGEIVKQSIRGHVTQRFTLA